MDPFVLDVYKEMYPQSYNTPFPQPITGYTLFEASLATLRSDIAPHEVDLSTMVGRHKLNVPILSAPMDTVTGPVHARMKSAIGGVGIIFRTKRQEIQLKMVEDALRDPPCLVSKPEVLRPDQTLDDLIHIYNTGIKTIPVVGYDGVLLGVCFGKELTFEGHEFDKVTDWMVRLENLKVEQVSTPFETIRNRLQKEQGCTVLPVIDHDKKFHGMYFKKDFFVANPTWHNGKPLVGMAIGASQDDLNRLAEGIKLGVGMVVVDSSHGHAKAVMDQTERALVLCRRAGVTLIAGNIADIDGYFNYAKLGVDAVKFGIGSGSICTTTKGTGAGTPVFTLIKEVDYLREKMREKEMHTPSVIVDGGVPNPGIAARAIGVGADAVMAGEWMVGAHESHSVQTYGVTNGMVYYRGMASKAAIDARVNDRYGQNKSAEEGIEGWVPYRGPMRKWIRDDLELLRGGFAHQGARNIAEMHRICRDPQAWRIFTGAGQRQNDTRVEEKRS